MESETPVNDEETLSQQAADGDQGALQTLLFRNRDRLKNMVRLRIPTRLLRRIDESDIVQEAMMQAAMNIGNYEHHSASSFYLWVRQITENKLIEAYRRHYKASKRDINREVNIVGDTDLSVNSKSVALHFLQRSGSNPARKVMQLELRQVIQDALDGLEPIDREALVLHHFEQLSMSEMATVLGLSKSGAAHRYMNAIIKFRKSIEAIPGLLDDWS